MQLLAIASFLLAAQVIPGTGASRQGRNGNDHYKEDRFEEAADAFAGGIAAYEDGRTPDRNYFGLQNNLGAALYRQEQFDAADAAFARAAEHAPGDPDFARASYNAGNASFQRQDLESALAHYRNALLADPANEDARYNYEFVRRQQEEQQQDQQNQEQNQEQQQQDQNNEQQSQEQEQNQDEQQQEQQQDQEQQQSQEQQQQQEQPQQSEAREEELTQEQAERILQALEDEEQQLLREIQKVEGRPRRVAKDW